LPRQAFGVQHGAVPSHKPALSGPVGSAFPGSVNRKYPDHPVLYTIERLNIDAELHLVGAAERPASAFEGDEPGAQRRKGGVRASVNYQCRGEPVSDTALVAVPMAAFPNADAHHDEWIRPGYAVCGATTGSNYSIWHKSATKHSDGETEAAWGRIVAAGVTRDRRRSILSGAKRCGRIDPHRADDANVPVLRLQQADRCWRTACRCRARQVRRTWRRCDLPPDRRGIRLASACLRSLPWCAMPTEIHNDP